MPGLIIGGIAIQVPEVKITNFIDSPKLQLSPEDRAPRPTRWVRSIYLHTTQGDDNLLVRPGVGRELGAMQTLDWWKLSSASAGAHGIQDYDGSAYCCADLLNEIAWNTGTTNNKYCIGWEIKQTLKGEVWSTQIASVVAVCDMITACFGIQRQVQWPYRGHAIPRLAEGSDAIGVFGHRDCSNDRGRGDPGDWITQALILAGYEPFDFAACEDRAAWKARQGLLNQKFGARLTLDGVPGPATWNALKVAGFPDGMWIKRDIVLSAAPAAPVAPPTAPTPP